MVKTKRYTGVPDEADLTEFIDPSSVGRRLVTDEDETCVIFRDQQAP